MLLSDRQKERIEILAVSVDPPEKLQMMIDRISKEDGLQPDFPFLSDPDHHVIDRYGLFNPAESKGRPVPHPTTLIVDRDGVVRWKFVEVNYKIRPSNEDILAGLAAIGEGAEESAPAADTLATANPG